MKFWTKNSTDFREVFEVMKTSKRIHSLFRTLFKWDIRRLPLLFHARSDVDEWQPPTEFLPLDYQLIFPFNAQECGWAARRRRVDLLLFYHHIGLCFMISHGWYYLKESLLGLIPRFTAKAKTVKLLRCNMFPHPYPPHMVSMSWEKINSLVRRSQERGRRRRRKIFRQSSTICFLVACW